MSDTPNPAAFGLEVFRKHREHCADLDGATLHDLAIKHGLIVPVEMSGSCATEDCECLCDDDFAGDEPRTCWRPAKGLERIDK